MRLGGLEGIVIWRLPFSILKGCAESKGEDDRRCYRLDVQLGIEMAVSAYFSESIQERELPRELRGVRSFHCELDGKVNCVEVLEVFRQCARTVGPHTKTVIDVPHVHTYWAGHD